MSKISRSNDFKVSLKVSGFTGDLTIPGDPDYTSSLSRFAKNAQKEASLVAFVRSAEDVSRVIQMANGYSPTRGAPAHVVVRGGGHSTSGASSSDGGIVIDLSRYVNTVRVDEKEKLAYVGGGANWAAVDSEAIKYGLATTGGTVNHTGVGGLSLGGGLGWTMGEHSIVIDNLVQVTLVTADGSILIVNSTSHLDLFWGIRGGGCNFGCVTEFVYRLHPQRRNVFAGPLIFPPPLLPAVMSTLQEWYPTASEKEAAILGMTNKGPMGGPAVLVIVFYNGDEEEGRKRFTKLIGLGPVVNATGMVPYEAINAMQNDGLPYGGNYHLTGSLRGEIPVTADSVQGIFNRLIEIASGPGECAQSGAPGMSMIWEFINLKKMASVPADATAFRMRVTHPSMPILISWEGDSVEASKDAKERLRALKYFVEEEVKVTFEGGMGENDTGYGNYESGNPQSMDAAATLYGANYQRLQELKRLYDPSIMFRSWFPIIPAKVAA